MCRLHSPQTGSSFNQRLVIRLEYIVGTSAADGLIQFLGGASNVAAMGTLTSDNTNVGATQTVVIEGQTYTFVSALTPLSGEVLIGTDADGSLLNLIRAINGTGTPGTDYAAGTPVNTAVTAANSVTSHAFAVTAKISGSGGNAITTTETSPHLSWGSTHLTGGVDGTSTGAELPAAAYPTDLQGTFLAIFYQLM